MVVKRALPVFPVFLGVLGFSTVVLSALLVFLPLTAATQSPLSGSEYIPAGLLPPAPEPAPLAVLAAARSSMPPSRPKPAVASNPAESLAPVPPIVPPQPDYAAMVVDYFSEVGFGQEYGSASPVLHKWTQDVTLRVFGAPTAADLEALNLTVGELNRLLTGVQLILTDGDADLEVYFAPESSFAGIEPKYVPGNLGFFRVWWDGQGAIYKGRILISSDGITQEERSHLIREELTQSLGLFRDSWRYPESIFYQGWTATPGFAPIDGPTIQLLYQPQLSAGMTQVQVRDLIMLD